MAGSCWLLFSGGIALFVHVMMIMKSILSLMKLFSIDILSVVEGIYFISAGYYSQVLSE